MKSNKSNRQSPTPHQRLSFQSKLECIATGMNYFALSVPKEITHTLGTHGPVPVLARVNGSEPFVASLYPVGGGRHYLRVRNAICKAVKIKQGSRVKVQITVRDRSDEISIPKDLASALRAKGAGEGFKAMPIGRKSFLLRWIDQAAKPETRDKRIQLVVQEAKRSK